jgi:hypothetical protein
MYNTFFEHLWSVYINTHGWSVFVSGFYVKTIYFLYIWCCFKILISKSFVSLWFILCRDILTTYDTWLSIKLLRYSTVDLLTNRELRLFPWLQVTFSVSFMCLKNDDNKALWDTMSKSSDINIYGYWKIINTFWIILIFVFFFQTFNFSTF